MARSRPRLGPVLLLTCVPLLGGCLDAPRGPAGETDASTLRRSSMDLVRSSLDSGSAPSTKISFAGAQGPWTVDLKAYSSANGVASVRTSSADLTRALEQAVLGVRRAGMADPTIAKEARLVLEITPAKGAPVRAVEFEGRTLEGLPAGRVAVRSLDRGLLRAKIVDAKRYLLGVMDPVLHAFPKKYDALKDRAESRVRTIYSASALWTLLKLESLEDDPRLKSETDRIADFLLSMQVAEGRHRGAFYYSQKDGRRQDLFVVGTASKTIFTLLELHRRTGEARYLDAAARAGDWLLSAQDPGGVLTSTFRLKDGVWHETSRFSTLYHGQVLSALSRLYAVTREERFLTGARKLAGILTRRAAEQGYFLRDDYRLTEDPVPTSWGVMGLFDYHRAVGDEEARSALLRLAASLMDRQRTDRSDIFNLGRFEGTTASSGNGWINEVFSEVYLYGKSNGWDPETLGKLRGSILAVTRWLVQNTYSGENAYAVRNPSRAIGGLIRNYSESVVRTDAVCHGVNGYINMLNEWPDGPLIDLPESP